MPTYYIWILINVGEGAVVSDPVTSIQNTAKPVIETA